MSLDPVSRHVLTRSSLEKKEEVKSPTTSEKVFSIAITSFLVMTGCDLATAHLGSPATLVLCPILGVFTAAMREFKKK